MNSETLRSVTSLQAMVETAGRQLTWWQTGANLIGACIVTSYFVFFDQVFSAMRIQNTFYVLGIMFPVLVLIAIGFLRSWQKDLDLFLRLHSQKREIEAELQKSAQRKILDVPYMSALTSLFCWFLAAITMTTFSLISGSGGGKSLAVVLNYGLRTFVGCIIGGIIVAAIIFFITEAKIRQIWPHFFPAGGLARTPGTFRLKLRIRMFVIFLLASILPLILMAVLSYNKARMMLVMDPTEVIQSLLYLTAFLLAVTLFYLQIDRVNHSLSWVRAGHEPAVLYDPSTDRFEELAGKGIALGIEDNWQYKEIRQWRQ